MQVWLLLGMITFCFLVAPVRPETSRSCTLELLMPDGTQSCLPPLLPPQCLGSRGKYSRKGEDVTG